MPARVGRGKMIGRGRGHRIAAYVVRAPPAGTSGMINASKIYGSLSSIQYIYPLSADAYTLGSTTKEWLALYIGDAGGIYFGLGQDIFLSRGAANRLDLATGDSFNLVSGDLMFGATSVITSAKVLQNVTANASIITAGTFGTARLDLSALAQNIAFTGAQTVDGVDISAFKTAFDDHSALHENGGGDEISVAGLSGLLADDQHVLDAEVIAAIEGEATLDLAGDVTIATGKHLDVDEIYFDKANRDIVLRRAGANLLQTPDNFEGSTIQSVKGSTWNNAFRVIVSGEGNDRLTIRSDGTLRWSGGPAAWDTNLYRSSANLLKTDDQLQVVGGLITGADIYSDAADTDSLGSTAREWLNIYIGDAGKLYFGLGQDVNLYRSAANVLKTDDTLEIALGVYHSNVVTKVNADTPYTVAASDRVILCDTSGGVIELDLPAVAGVTGMILTIKKTTADATVVTLDGDGAEEIDGAVNNTEIDAQWDTLTIYCDGTQWLIIAHKIA